MKESIEQIKFNEAKALVEQLKDIAMFNENIKLIAIVVNKAEEEEVEAITTAKGDRESLTELYANLTATLTSTLYEDHTCPCVPANLEKAAKTGISIGLMKAIVKGVDE